MPHLGVDAWGSYDKHGNVAPKTEDAQRASNERAQVEQVFALTGGELMDVAWMPTYSPTLRASLADRVTATRTVTFTYWYQGVPEYVQSEYDAMPLSYAPTYRTVCEQELYGNVPEIVTDDEGTWKRVARYSSSGETECPYRWNDDNDDTRVVPARVTSEHDCPLCDESPGEPHGYIYIGDGWSEIVYRLEPAGLPPIGAPLPLVNGVPTLDFGDDD